MWFHIDMNSHVPVYKQICERIKAMIISGKLKEGDYVPSVRKLALDLGVNVNTVARAYRELVNEGVLQSIRGEGYIVKGIGRSFLERKLKDFKKNLQDLKTMGVSEGEIEKILKEVFHDDTNG